MEAKHTPPPWTVKTVTWDHGDRDAFIIQEMEDEFDRAVNDEAMEAANARFAANRVVVEAAPDLLATLRSILREADFAQGEWVGVTAEYSPEWTLPLKEIAEKAHDAIAKVRAGS